MSLAQYPLSEIHSQLIELSKFRFMPPGYLSQEEQQRILIDEWLSDGNKKKIKKPMEWIADKSTKRATKDQLLKIYCYNEVCILNLGIRIDFSITRMKGTKEAIVHGYGFTIVPYTRNGIIESERITVPFPATSQQLFDLCHSLLPTIKKTFWDKQLY